MSDQLSSGSEYDMVNNQKYVESIVWRLEPSSVLVELEHYFKGEFWDESVQQWKAEYPEPLMNLKGIRHLVTELRSRLNKNIVLSKLQQSDINRICLEFRLELIYLIEMKYDEWEIDESNWDAVLYQFDHHIYPFLMRALDGGERDSITNQVRIVDQKVTTVNEEKKKGLLFK